MANDRQISGRIPENDALKLEYLARHDDTSFGAQLRRAIKTYLHNRKKTVYPSYPRELTGE